MNNSKRLTVGILSSCLLTVASMAAHGAFVIQGGSTQSLPGNNSFDGDLTGLGFDQMTSGAQLRVNQDGYIDFYYIGADSSYNDRFTNNSGFFTEHNEGFNFAGYAGFSIAVAANDIVDFSFTSDGADALTPVDNLNNTNLLGLGIYTDSMQSGPLQQVVLGYDDQMSNPDRDFNDLLVRADFRPVSAVPLPAAVWLFGAGLTSLAGFARRCAKRRYG